jgi:hypothetical protein
LSKVLNRLEEFWFAPVDERPLACCRLIFSLAALANLWTLFVQRKYILYYGSLPDGLYSRGDGYYYSIFSRVPSEVLVSSALVFAVLCIVGLNFGRYYRFFAIGCFVWQNQYVQKILPVVSGFDYLLTVISFVLMISPAPRLLTWRSWRSVGPGAEKRLVAAYPLILLRWQFLLVFFMTTFYKAASPAWRQGWEAGQFLISPYSYISWPWLLDHPVANALVTYSVLLIELVVPFFLYRRNSRMAGYLLFCPLVTAILLSKVWVYGLTILAVAVCFLEERDFRHLAELGKASRGERLKILGRDLIAGVADFFGRSPKT